MSNLLPEKDCRKQKKHTLTGFIQRVAHRTAIQGSELDIAACGTDDSGLEPDPVSVSGRDPNENSCEVGDRSGSVGLSETTPSESKTDTCALEMYNQAPWGDIINRQGAEEENSSVVKEIEQKCCETVTKLNTTHTASVTDISLSEQKKTDNNVSCSGEKLVDFCCPICKQQLHIKNLMKINKHVDMCLLQKPEDELNVRSHTGNEVSVCSDVVNQVQPTGHTNKVSDGTKRMKEYAPSHKIITEQEETTSGLEIEVSSPVCPICYIEQTGCTLSVFNSHVDNCLSKGTIREILKEQSCSERISLKRFVC